MIYLFGFIGSILAANVLIATFGVIPVGFGLLAPAGVLAAGAALSFRDGVQETLGRRWVAGGILAGAALSALVSPQFALASGVAFLVSEAADFAVYTPLRERNRYGAVLLSNTVGAVVDSALFLALAFGSLDFLPGQVVGKLEVTLLTLAVMWLWRVRRVTASVGGH
jgi:uncharacterized PurR-regulated membrane protein YhhQ (DUF165 family)